MILTGSAIANIETEIWRGVVGEGDGVLFSRAIEWVGREGKKIVEGIIGSDKDNLLQVEEKSPSNVHIISSACPGVDPSAASNWVEFRSSTTINLIAAFFYARKTSCSIFVISSPSLQTRQSKPAISTFLLFSNPLDGHWSLGEKKKEAIPILEMRFFFARNLMISFSLLF